MQPVLIQPDFLVRRSPERADLLLLVPDAKGLLPHTQRDELLEAFCLGVATASLPLRHGAPGRAKLLSQAHLREADGAT